MTLSVEAYDEFDLQKKGGLHERFCVIHIGCFVSAGWTGTPGKFRMLEDFPPRTHSKRGSWYAQQECTLYGMSVLRAEASMVQYAIASGAVRCGPGNDPAAFVEGRSYQDWPNLPDSGVPGRLFDRRGR